MNDKKHRKARTIEQLGEFLIDRTSARRFDPKPAETAESAGDPDRAEAYLNWLNGESFRLEDTEETPEVLPSGDPYNSARSR